MDYACRPHHAPPFVQLLRCRIDIQRAEEDDSEQPQETAGKRSSVGVTAANRAVLGSALLAAIVVPVVFISIFFSWDVRRLSASRTLALGWDAPTTLERALMWDKIQSEAPERESFTFSLFEQYLKMYDERWNKS